MHVAVIIPTLNGGEDFLQVLAGLRGQSLKPQTLLVLDSGSVDDTIPRALAAGARVHRLAAANFNHGATRELGRRLLKADAYLFMTQDALPAHARLVENLVKPLAARKDIGLAYARQLPRQGASPLEAFNREFNYPAVPQLKRREDRDRLGVKTVFCSDTCAAYPSAALEAVGGFAPVIMCEDQHVAARMLAAGYSIYYAADALVFHSHDYSLREEFKRYFDLGVFFGSHERWIADRFGGADREGMRLVRQGRRYLSRTGQAHLLPQLLGRLLVKWLGYQLGSRERLLPVSLKARLSLHRGFWQS